MNELNISGKIQVIPGTIQFDEFENLRSQAEQIAEFINGVDGSEENAKTAKKVLAAARKAVKGLSDKRIEIKKSYLLPYETFEAKIKEITSVIEKADSRLNEKLKEIEKQEKAEKLEVIQAAYEYIVTPELKKIAGFDWFMRPEYLNKGATISRIEKEIRETSNRIDTEIGLIRNMAEADEIMTEYIQSDGDFTGAVAAAERRKQAKERSRVAVSENVKIIGFEDVKPEKRFVFTVTGEYNAQALRAFLDRHEIEYSEGVI